MPQEKEPSCPKCGTVYMEERCPNPNCPNYGFCLKCSSLLDSERMCTSDMCDTNRPTPIPSQASVGPFATSHPPRQSLRRLMTSKHPFTSAYDHLLERRRLRHGSPPGDLKEEKGFGDEEPPTLQEPVQVTTSGTWRFDDLDDPAEQLEAGKKKK